MRTWLIRFALLIALLGIVDAGYLTLEHYRGSIPPCGVAGLFNDCGKVLTSPYAVVWGIPLALIGLIYYILEYVVLVSTTFSRHSRGVHRGISTGARSVAVILSTGGLGASMYFVYLQLFVIGALCKYCMVSAVLSMLMFGMVQHLFEKDRKYLVTFFMGIVYRNLLKPIFFLMDPERVHVSMVAMGKFLGDMPLGSQFMSFLFRITDPRLIVQVSRFSTLNSQLSSLTFPNPVGLAAGFDYNADLTQILGSVGFGFQTVGTITNHPYEGNPRPMLGRLPKSKSLMVNKGFKNLGVKATIAKLEGKKFPIPVGISIGVTNSSMIKTQKQAINDITETFIAFESSRVAHSYYELNISCPNLFTKVSFYEPKNLKALLDALAKLQLTRPVFIKMPIEESNTRTLAMLAIIARSTSTGVIFGNLAHNRDNPAIDRSEVNKYAVGNFSGKPTWDRSNELISLTHKHYKNRLVIIGCGGIFSAADAKEKLRRGATLVQLITGMIYQGPQLISEINQGLLE